MPSITSVSLSSPSELLVGEQYELTASVIVDGTEYTNRFITWTSDDENIVTVDENGILTANNTGHTLVHVYGWDGYSDYFEVGVNDLHGLSSVGPLYISIYDNMNVSANFTGYGGEGYYDYDNETMEYNSISGSSLPLVYTSSDASIVSVNEKGDIVGLKKGTAQIIATYKPTGITASLTVTVLRDVSSFKLPGRILVPVSGGAVDLPVQSMMPEDADATDLIWTVEPQNLAKIENGTITALTNNDQTGTITARTVDGKTTHSTNLVIYSPWVDRIELEPIEYAPTGKNLQINAHVFCGDEEYINQLVTFYSSGGSIDSRSGVMQCNYPNTSYITATAANGVQSGMNVRFMPEFSDFEITDVVFLRVDNYNHYTDDDDYYEYDIYDYDANDNHGEINLKNYVPLNGSYDYDDYYQYGPECLFCKSDFPEDIYVYSDENAGVWYVYSKSQKKGIYTVTISSINGISKQTKVICYDENDIEGVSIAPVKTIHPIYDTINLNADISLYGETVSGDQFVTWESSDSSVITVNTSGVARTLKYGTATITATTSNGMTGSVTLQVKEIPDEFDYDLYESYSCMYGQTITLTCESVYPEDTEMELSLSVEPDEIVKIDGDKITPVVNQNAEAVITATNWDGSVRTSRLVIRMNENSLSTLYMPNALTEIEDEAFEGCAAECIVISRNCTSIGNYAFAHANNLRCVHIPSTVTSISATAFDGISELQIYGETGSIAEEYAISKGFTFIAE